MFWYEEVEQMDYNVFQLVVQPNLDLANGKKYMITLCFNTLTF